jgi:hypothetical protein
MAILVGKGMPSFMWLVLHKLLTLTNILVGKGMPSFMWLVLHKLLILTNILVGKGMPSNLCKTSHIKDGIPLPTRIFVKISNLC